MPRGRPPGFGLSAPPRYVQEWFESGLTSGQIAYKTGRNATTIASIMAYWRERMAENG